MGLLFVAAVAALAAYLRCCQAGNESIVGYQPVEGGDFDDFSESDHLVTGKEPNQSLYEL